MHRRRGFVVLLSVVTGLVAAGSADGAVILTPNADTYISSANTTTNYGTVNQLVQNVSTGNTNRRWFYLTYDLTSVTQSITDARLDLWQTTVVSGAPVTLDIYGMTANKLTPTLETTLTFGNDANRSGSGTSSTLVIANTYNSAPLASFVSAVKSSPGQDVAFNTSTGPVLDYLNGNLGGTATFAVFGPTFTGSSGWIWSSREDPVAANRPTLTLTVPEPAALSLVGFTGLLALRRRRNRAR